MTFVVKMPRTKRYAKNDEVTGQPLESDSEDGPWTPIVFSAVDNLDLSTLQVITKYDYESGKNILIAWARTFAHGCVRKITCAQLIENGDTSTAETKAIEGINELCHRYDTDESYRNEMNAKFDADAEELRRYMESDDEEST